jgi:putative transposase
MNERISSHRPPHTYLNDTWYFVTASTVDRQHYLSTDNHLRLWVEILQEQADAFGVVLSAWVILPNHYHILFKSHLGRDIGKFIGRLHGRTSRGFNLLDNTKGRQVWYNYWDTCIRTEKDCWTRFNYIHNNPVKHGYVRKHPDWKFSSYHRYLRTKGEEWLADCWQRYPVVDFREGDDY